MSAPDDYGCPLHAQRNPSMNLVGTVCVPDDAYSSIFSSNSADIKYVNFDDPSWYCPDRNEKDDGAGVFMIIMMNLIFGVGWIPIAAIFCCYFRNKSQNTAPFNGGQVRSFPQVVKAQVPQMQVVQMQCPEGAIPGQTVETNVNGQTLTVQIPAEVAPGTMFQVRSIG
eukprot:COSAG02_NODE_16780_length_1056_cov_1.370951_1_plen_168_part_10